MLHNSYVHSNTTLNTTITLDDGDDLGAIEDLGQTKLEESDDEETPQTATDIVLTSPSKWSSVRGV